MAININFDANAGKKIADYIQKPLSDIRDFWGLMGQVLDRDAMLAFRLSGARGGNPAWAPLAVKTMFTEAFTPKIRYGTDLRPLEPSALRALRQAWGWAHVGKMRKGVRRYSLASKPLLASGGFMRSFGVKEIGENHMSYGTNHEKAEEIMSVKNRQVLFITPMDERNYMTLFRNWFVKGLA